MELPKRERKCKEVFSLLSEYLNLELVVSIVLCKLGSFPFH